jgi:hypothetical protein
MEAKMICPKCDREMNFHAEKFVYVEPALPVDTVSGGQIEEIHTCPNCGNSGSRPATALS